MKAFLKTAVLALSLLQASYAQDLPPVSLTYTNPVWDGYLADPQVMLFEGTYYAYGTGELGGKQFPILKSKDFAKWEPVGGALAPLKDLGIKEYWAPEVVEREGVFYLYYAGNRKMRVATSKSPEGPFQDSGIELFPDLEFSIDAHPFHDPVSGKWYLFFARDFFDERPGTALSVVELNDDMISTKGPMHTVLRAFADWQIYERERPLYDKIWPAWHTVEGPTVIYRDGKYHCFYSGGNWQTPGYGVGCAVSDSVTGPYIDNKSREKASVLSTIPGKLIGPGHNSVIMGPDKKTMFMVYHSWNAEKTARQMCLDPLVWTKNGPKCVLPSRGKKTIALPLTKMPIDHVDADEPAPPIGSTFVNPIYEGADPFVMKHSDGFYYFCQSEGDHGIAIWKSKKLTDKGVKRMVWRAPKAGWNTAEVWAPELHYLRGKWVIYYAADSGDNADHLTGVLESVGPDAQGEYIDRGIVYTGDELETGKNNRWAIDATPLEMGGKLYLIWSGWHLTHDAQSLYIAEMENAWTVKRPRVKIAENNTYDWEKISEDPKQIGLHEGPQIIKNKGKIYLIYSCSSSWEKTYKLGQLSIDESADPMDPNSWIKKKTPVFVGNEKVLGVGHATFVNSPDDKENWIVYHSKMAIKHGWERDVRIQPFTWNEDGSPHFGPALEAGVPQSLPSGEALPVKGTTFSDRFAEGNWDKWRYFGQHQYIRVADGKLVLGVEPESRASKIYQSGEKAVVRDQLWDDFTFQTSLKIVEGNGEAGVIFRVHHLAIGLNAFKGYFVGISPESGKIVLEKMDGHERHELTSVDHPVKNGDVIALKVMAEGQLIQVFLNDKLVIKTRDASYLNGLVGLRVVNAQVEFSEVEISDEQ